MTPYYDEAGITIYHGDALDVLPLLSERCDIAVTSPPYNLNCPTKPGGGFSGTETKGKWTRAAEAGGLGEGYADHGDNMPMDEYEEWQRSVLTTLWDAVEAIFYNHKPRPWLGQVWLPTRLNPGLPLRQVIVWARAGGINFSPSHYVPMHEWILLFARADWRLKSKGASGVGDVWTIPQESNPNHPAPFPVGLPARAIETTGARSVLDPFMGSGSTMRAAKDAGVRGVGIELSERYCEIAANRLAQEVLDLGAA